MVVFGKGILVVDESSGIIKKWFDFINVEFMEEN